MNNKKNQYILIAVVTFLLLIVIALTIYFIITNHHNNDKSMNVKINQIYSSDYNLEFMGDYYLGTYEDNNINVIINKNGEEIYTSVNNLYYDHIYMLKDGNHLIYNIKDNILNAYIFDGKTISFLYSIEGATNIKPIICNNSYQEYIIGFVSLIDNNTYIYNILDGKRLELNDIIIIGDNIINDTYYVRNDEYLIVKNKDNLMGAIDYTGKVIIDFKYKNLINTYHNSFVALNEKDKYGLLSNTSEEILKFNYNAIDIYPNYYLVVNNNNKIAIYNKKYEKITNYNMNYDPLITFDLRNTLNSLKLYEAGGRLYVINNNSEDFNKTEYERHNLYVINNGKIIKTINQIGFNINGLIYYYDKDYNINIFDTDFNQLFTTKLNDVKTINDIKYISNNIININYLNNKDEVVNKYYQSNGEETSFNLGTFLFKYDEYQGYIKEENNYKTLTIYDNDNQKLNSITGKKIQINGNYLIVDNAIYEIIKEGNN